MLDATEEIWPRLRSSFDRAALYACGRRATLVTLSSNTKLVLSVLGALALFASPALAQALPGGPSAPGIYNVVIAPNTAYNPDDPAETGGGSVGYNEMLREEW